MKKVLFAASESVPFIKTGGLADVVGTLPYELKKLDMDVRVVIPKSDGISWEFKNNMKFIKSFTVNVGWRNQYCGVLEFQHKGVKFYFIDNEYYFKREEIYGHFDDGERFSFFNKAVIKMIKEIDFKPDILHCHDWHAGMISVILNENHKDDAFYKDIKTVFTIHNLKYQGLFPKETLIDLLGLDYNPFTPDGVEYHDMVSFLKGGVAFSNAVTTVSETYAEEIKTPYYGEGLDNFLNSKDSIHGIINGIDYDEYDPSKDNNIFKNYDIDSLESRSQNKEDLQKVLGLPIKPSAPIIGMVTRLVKQKGIDLFISIFDELLSDDIQMVVLGSGEEKFENLVSEFARRYPDKFKARVLFDNELAHKIYAGADMFLMPSLFEPCGIGQLIALRYGCVPIVRETGGLKDTVYSYNENTGEGNGFSFTNFNGHDMLYTIKRAISFYKEKPLWEKIQKQGMLADYSWEKSAKRYKELYLSLNEA